MEDNINKNWKKFLNEEMTKAQELGITKFPYKEFDKNNNEIYFEDSKGFWDKSEFDENGNRIYHENSTGFWAKSEFDENRNEIYYEDSDGIIKNQSKNTQWNN